MDKIIIMGLAQSGKTTIVKVTAEGMIPAKKAAYSATLDYKRNTYDIFGKKVSMFDLGGQKSFMDRFIGELAEFVFTNVSALVFVIDVGNMDTISLAKYYYEMGKKTLKKYSPTAGTKILLHKMDLIDPSKNDFIASIKEFLDFDNEDTIFETNVFDKSIFIAMEKIVKGLDKEPENAESLLTQFKSDHENLLDLVLLIDSDNNSVVTLGKTGHQNSLFTSIFDSKLFSEFKMDNPFKYSFNQFKDTLVFSALLNGNHKLILVYVVPSPEILSNDYTTLLNDSVRLLPALEKFIS